MWPKVKIMSSLLNAPKLQTFIVDKGDLFNPFAELILLCCQLAASKICVNERYYRIATAKVAVRMFS